MQIEDYGRRWQPRRSVQGISAMLLPYGDDGHLDEASFRRHLLRTHTAGLRVAVNMDTGYIDLLTAEEKRNVLRWTRETLPANEWFVAGALPNGAGEDIAGDYLRECDAITSCGGVPILFPSAPISVLDDGSLIGFFQQIAAHVERFLAFELGTMFNVHGRIFSPRVLEALLQMPQCVGLKHSSLDRATELQRLALRDRLRPEFAIYSGNDLAADMIEYGSDYLLGLSTFDPELFAARDRAWQTGAPYYFELRDWIQYLGWIGFRDPVPAYKHSAAMFLKFTGAIASDNTHPRAMKREAWDRELLADAARRLTTFKERGIAGLL